MNNENELSGVVAKALSLEGFLEEIDPLLSEVIEVQPCLQAGGEMKEPLYASSQPPGASLCENKTLAH